jgi:putative hydrolase of the HAD superfamily
MQNSTPQFLFFDLGNVLLYFSHELGCRQMAEVSGSSYEKVWQVVYSDGGLEWRYERNELSDDEFYEAFCQQTRTQPDYHALQLAGSAIFELNTSILPIVTQLVFAGHRMGILSNTCRPHWEYISRRFTIVEKLFRVHALSYQLDALKPEPPIYAAAAKLAGLPPHEIFFVDDRADNVAGARNSGFDAVQYTTSAALAAALRDRGVGFNY